jgi:hypothetical protein
MSVYFILLITVFSNATGLQVQQVPYTCPTTDNIVSSNDQLCLLHKLIAQNMSTRRIYNTGLTRIEGDLDTVYASKGVCHKAKSAYRIRKEWKSLVRTQSSYIEMMIETLLDYRKSPSFEDLLKKKMERNSTRSSACKKIIKSSMKSNYWVDYFQSLIEK